MRKDLYEFSVGPNNLSRSKTFYVICQIMFILSIIALVLSMIFMTLILILTSLTSAIFFFWVKGKFYNFYDYNFVAGSIRIAKVVNNVKRRKCFLCETKDIENIGLVGGDAYLRYEKDKSYKKVFATPNAVTDDFCYIVATVEGVKYLVYLEYDETFISCIFAYTGKKVFEKELIEKGS